VHAPDSLAHYARACTDVMFKFPFGTQERPPQPYCGACEAFYSGRRNA
jgi:hypothetical protein